MTIITNTFLKTLNKFCVCFAQIFQLECFSSNFVFVYTFAFDYAAAPNGEKNQNFIPWINATLSTAEIVCGQQLPVSSTNAIDNFWECMKYI